MAVFKEIKTFLEGYGRISHFTSEIGGSSDRSSKSDDRVAVGSFHLLEHMDLICRNQESHLENHDSLNKHERIIEEYLKRLKVDGKSFTLNFDIWTRYSCGNEL